MVLLVHPVNSVPLLSGGTERCQHALKQLTDVREPGSIFSLPSPSWQDFTFLFQGVDVPTLWALLEVS